LKELERRRRDVFLKLAFLEAQLFGDDTSSLAKVIQDTLRSFRVDAEVRPEDISIGPTVIRFGIRPTGKPAMKIDEKGRQVPVKDAAGNIVYESRTRVSRIMALQNDLALVLEAKTIIEAKIPDTVTKAWKDNGELLPIELPEKEKKSRKIPRYDPLDAMARQFAEAPRAPQREVRTARVQVNVGGDGEQGYRFLDPQPQLGDRPDEAWSRLDQFQRIEPERDQWISKRAERCDYRQHRGGYLSGSGPGRLSGTDRLARRSGRRDL